MNTETLRHALAARERLRGALHALDAELERFAQEQAEAEATFLREARRELDSLIAEHWGPPISGRRQ